MKRPPLLALVAPLLAASCGGGNGGQPEVLNQQLAGIIPIEMFTNGTSGYAYNIDPSFIQAQPQDVCSIVTFAPCTIVTCPAGRAGDPAESAGALTVAVDTTVDTFEWGPGYMNTMPSMVLFNGGETISVQASGDIVPAFSGSVTAPSPLVVTAPTSNPLAISQSQPLQVSWTGQSAGDLILQLTTTNATDSVTVECELSADAETATIPVTALAQIAQGMYTAEIVSRTRSEIGAGGWSVLLDAEYQAAIGTDSNAGAYVRPAVVGP